MCPVSAFLKQQQRVERKEDPSVQNSAEHCSLLRLHSGCEVLVHHLGDYAEDRNHNQEQDEEQREQSESAPSEPKWKLSADRV